MYQHLDLEMYCIPSVHPAHRDRILYRQEMLSSHLVPQNFYFALIRHGAQMYLHISLTDTTNTPD